VRSPTDPAASTETPLQVEHGVSASESALQVQFLTQLGHALANAGDPVSSTERTLRDVADAYGMAAVGISVLPTMVLVRAQQDLTRSIDMAGTEVDDDLRLDQVGALFEVVDQARQGRLSAQAGLDRLAAMWTAPARFGSVVRVLGHIILSVGLGLIITPRPSALLYCAGLGLMVGLLTELGDQWSALDVLLPALGSGLVAVVVFEATKAGQVVAPLLLLIPPLITFLPGGTLTTAMVELADRHPIAGATRLVAGSTQVVLIVFGILAGQALVGIPPELAFAQRSDNLIGWWGPVLGPLVFAIGIYYHFVGPRGSLPWLCVIVYVAWAGETLGNDFLGGYFGGFVGALTMTMVAFWLDRLSAAPPFLVLFLPAFWLLVPGVLAVVGLADLVGNEAAVALFDLGRAAFTIVSIALGVLAGVAIARAVAVRA